MIDLAFAEALVKAYMYDLSLGPRIALAEGDRRRGQAHSRCLMKATRRRSRHRSRRQAAVVPIKLPVFSDH